MASIPGRGYSWMLLNPRSIYTTWYEPPIAVSEGRGKCTRNSTHIAPVSPTVARKIVVSNQVATDATQDVSLEQVSTAMEQVTADDEAGKTKICPQVLMKRMPRKRRVMHN